MADIPEGIGWGTVTGRFGEIVSDGPDAGRVPDVVDLAGTVTLTPLVPWLQVPGEGAGRYRLAVLECPVISGVMYPPGTTTPGAEAGVPVVATPQPGSVPEVVQWQASFQLEGIDPQPAPVVFDVPAGGVVDLAGQLGDEQQVPYVTVVSAEDAARAETAAVQAGSSAQAAAQSVTDAQTAAGAAATAAQTAASAATNAGTAAQDAAASAQAAATARQGAEAARDTVLGQIGASGPVPVPLSAGIGGSITVQRLTIGPAKLVIVQGTATGIAAVASTEKPLGSLPAGYRPVERVAGDAYFYATGATSGVATISTTGTLAVVQSSGNRNSVTVSVSWFE